MPFIDLPNRGVRIYARINNSTVADDGVDPKSLIDLEKPNLLLLHSVFSSVDSFDAQFADPRLSKVFNIIAFDSRFCGRTESEPRASFSLEESADDALAALTALNLTSRICILGQGFLGSVTATWLAIKVPTLVQSLILASPGQLECSPAVKRSMAEEWLPLALAHKVDGGTGEVPAEAMEVVRDYYFGTEHDRHSSVRDAFLSAFEARYGATHSNADLRHQANYFQRTMIPASLRARITCPVLILRGSADDAASPESASREWKEGFAGVKGGAECHELSGAPHLLMSCDANIASRLVLAFARRSIP